MTKMKLCPIEPTDEMICNTKGSLAFEDELICDYKSMTAECPTVEVVDVKELEELFRKRFEGMYSEEYDTLDVLECIFNNGYKIIKECE